jgi:RHS repeat-associated protein
MTNDLSSMESMETDPGHGPYGGAALTNTSATLTSPTFRRTQSSDMIDTYYIYSHDGKLLAEYDHSGNCVRDYIYSGDQLIAEYKPQTNTYYYYMSDQINTTRIITDGNGNVVYSALYGPYGDVQKVWTNTYDPKLKFSGKEREGYSDLDYFGARYYDHSSYRFISVDPIINKEETFYNPQLWNLYAYCNNNPITYFDPDGRESILKKLKKIVDPVVPKGMMPNIMRMKGWEKNRQDIDKKVEKAVQIAIIVGGAVIIIDMVAGDNTNVKGGGKTGRKINEKRAQKLMEQIEEAKKEKKEAKTKKEKQRIQKKIDHFRRSLKKSEEHARKKQGS